MVEEGKMLIDYATMNAIAIRKILKKYDKVRSTDPSSHNLEFLRVGCNCSLQIDDILCAFLIYGRYIALKMARTLDPSCSLNTLNFYNHLGL